MEALDKPISRKNFLTMAAIVAAGVIGFGALARRKMKAGTDTSLPLGLPEDSIFKPRADALERMRNGLKK